ncbi:PadR family transcriptional regulator [Pseudolysinimonas sp.]|uniref:PadR family transcriptional regulator n=1 Tax=Pseudolysinimonas sp. TaxID=2680009 RepID=UPI00286C32E4|nr:PadR family transcriptional regulator [Pseudolysinimonas sp.]
MSPPVFAHGHLRLYLLRLLVDRPMHGYEIIQALSDQSGGTYSPSAGTIYPRLGKLEEEGLVTKEADGRKTVYAITDAGRAELVAREPELDGIETEFTDSVRRLADEVRASVNDAMRTLKADLAAAAREARSEAINVARETTRNATSDPRVASRLQLHEAEAALTEFRGDVREELRAAAASGTLSTETVTLLTTGLTDLRRQLVQQLRG